MREQDGMLAAYENWASTYDTMPNPTRDLDAQVLRKVLRCRLAGCALELGCGTGKNTLWLAEQVDRLIAVDFSAAMLQRAKQRVGREVEFHVGDIRNEWPAASASLNAVVGNLVLEHIEDLGSSLPRSRARAARRWVVLSQRVAPVSPIRWQRCALLDGCRGNKGPGLYAPYSGIYRRGFAERF